MIPKYNCTLEEDQVITAISMVDAPAVESSFEVYSKEHQKYSYDESSHMVLAPIIRVNFDILRKDNEGNLYYINFTPEVAITLLERLVANPVDFNVDHSRVFPEGITPREYFIKNTALGINPNHFDDVADGSVFCSAHITNPDIWQDVLDGKFNGFSIELVHGREPIEDYSKLDVDDLLVSILTN